MKFIGRTIAISIIMFFHTSYLIYYFYRDGRIDIPDILGYPLFFCIAYWAGKQYDKATFFSEKDPLTNLYNRRFVMYSFDKILALTDRSNSKLFIMVIDCDNFKEINDIYGHSKGDLVLKTIGEALVKTTRKSDVVSRWGGDEFLINGQYKDDSGLQIIHQRLSEEFRNLYELIKLADEEMYNHKWKKKESQ
ncbi:GGDEF domain-containing protein [Paenibacillus frigoriresistens]|uniref:GGDEF domain-containing protein n=1 Tax=Paenibacillus alginolyticus TaxID=59839 RepID=UPI001563BC29|nr:GGDEF domain-containing protein [Paenibacillus frigoriresistens]NRF95564.1 GGDEF domain-containing protein [Paenibacillus frigoriresistens]